MGRDEATTGMGRNLSFGGASKLVTESVLAEQETSDMPEDVVLVRRTRGGDSAAFNRLVMKYQDRLYNVCFRICGQAEDARDLTQETFLKAYASMQSFAEQSTFYTWLYRIAVNLTISHGRRMQRRSMQTLSTDPGPGQINQQGVDLARRCGQANVPNPVESADRAETHRIVAEALGELDEDQRIVLVLKDIESLDYESIAEIVDAPMGTVKSRIHRARMALRDKLLPRLKEPA